MKGEEILSREQKYQRGRETVGKQAEEVSNRQSSFIIPLDGAFDFVGHPHTSAHCQTPFCHQTSYHHGNIPLFAPVSMPACPPDPDLAWGLRPFLACTSRAPFIDFTACLARCVALVAMEANSQAQNALSVHSTEAGKHTACSHTYAQAQIHVSGHAHAT